MGNGSLVDFDEAGDVLRRSAGVGRAISEECTVTAVAALQRIQRVLPEYAGRAHAEAQRGGQGWHVVALLGSPRVDGVERAEDRGSGAQR